MSVEFTAQQIDKLKTEIEKKDEIINFLENVSKTLGITHAGIGEILKSPDEEIREKLTVLFHKLSKVVESLYYNNPKK